MAVAPHPANDHEVAAAVATLLGLERHPSTDPAGPVIQRRNVALNGPGTLPLAVRCDG
jgi:hypothetical protein